MESAIEFLTIDREEYLDRTQMETLEKLYKSKSDDEREEDEDERKELYQIWCKLQDVDIYNDAKYCLRQDEGAKLWKDSKVTSLITTSPVHVFSVVADCKVFSKLNDYHDYEEMYGGIESFLEDLHRLAYDSNSFCLDLCRYSVNYHLFNDVRDRYPFDVESANCNQECLSKFCEHYRQSGRFPVTTKEWEILNDFNPEIEIFNENLSKFDQYCLIHNKGSNIWNLYEVDKLVRELPRVTFDIVSNCNVFSKTCCFDRYYREYGFGSFQDDIYTLAYDSPYYCLKICYVSYQYLSSKIIKTSFKAMDFPSNIASALITYLLDTKYADAFINIDREVDVISTSKDKESNCAVRGDFVKQYEMGSSVMDYFCLEGGAGLRLWTICHIPEFVEKFPEIAFRVLSHCKIFDEFKDYNEYEQERGGFFSFYGDIFMLARESPYICLKLCEASIWHYRLQETIYLYTKWERKRIISISLYEARQLKSSLRDTIPNELIEMIGTYLFEYKQEICKT